MKEKNERPFSCDICDYAFKLNKDLKRQRMIHTKEIHTKVTVGLIESVENEAKVQQNRKTRTKKKNMHMPRTLKWSKKEKKTIYLCHQIAHHEQSMGQVWK